MKQLLLISSLFVFCLLQRGESQPEECVRKADVQAIVNGALRDLTNELQQNLRAQQTLLQRMQAELQGFISYKEEETRDIVQELLSENSTRVEMRKLVEDMLEGVTQQTSLAHNSTEQTYFTEVLKSYLEGFLQQCHQVNTTTISPTTAESAPCGGPGWRRVVSLNMTDTSQTCPAGLSLKDYSKRTCGRSHDGDKACSSTTFSVGGTSYSKVCGRAQGYQWHRAYAFHDTSDSLDDYYVHGLSLTHGADGSREHIWTFAVGLQIINQLNSQYSCPCDQGATSPAPSFVGDDYYCESGATRINSFFQLPTIQPFPLWDGQVCSTDSTCCQHPDLPWFYKDLPASTTDDIELRLCCLSGARVSNIEIEQLELYVQ